MAEEAHDPAAAEIIEHDDLRADRGVAVAPSARSKGQIAVASRPVRWLTFGHVHPLFHILEPADVSRFAYTEHFGLRTGAIENGEHMCARTPRPFAAVPYGEPPRPPRRDEHPASVQLGNRQGSNGRAVQRVAAAPLVVEGLEAAATAFAQPGEVRL
eukprot:scaffold8620_cov62-Phaeocystis_antarctica.AAC.16